MWHRHGLQVVLAGLASVGFVACGSSNGTKGVDGATAPTETLGTGGTVGVDGATSTGGVMGVDGATSTGGVMGVDGATSTGGATTADVAVAADRALTEDSATSTDGAIALDGWVGGSDGGSIPTGGVTGTGGAGGVIVSTGGTTGPAGTGGAVVLLQGVFTLTGNLAEAREGHTSTLLPNGKVLMTGGYGTGSPSVSLASAELYDPATGTFAATGSMKVGRVSHTATLLPNGRVLIAGGGVLDANGILSTYLASAELYDSATGTFAATGSMTVGRVSHTATLLPNGRVLVAGGDGSGTSRLASAEIYDPATGAFAATGSMKVARNGHTATLLQNGKVLVVCGESVLNASSPCLVELYDLTGGTFTSAGIQSAARWAHTSTLLPNGKVLVAGGSTWDFTTHASSPFTSATLFDPSTETFTATGSTIGSESGRAATLLSSGQVLIAGGIYGSITQVVAELYDPAAGAFSATGTMNLARIGHTMTLLPSGKVLVAGGEKSSKYSLSIWASAELYE